MYEWEGGRGEGRVLECEFDGTAIRKDLTMLSGKGAGGEGRGRACERPVIDTRDRARVPLSITRLPARAAPVLSAEGDRYDVRRALWNGDTRKRRD